VKGRVDSRTIVLTVLVLAAACGPKTLPSPPSVAVPKYPEFIFPGVPQTLGPPAAVDRHTAGWGWLQAGDLRAAERSFSTALKQSAAFYPAEVGLAYVALAQKKYKDALLHFDRAVVANPRYAPALAGRADALLALGEQREAIQSIEAALQADPSLSELRSRIEVLRFRGQQQEIAGARKLAESGRLEEARAAYEAAIAASPQSPFLHRELADVERRAGNPSAALDYARKAAELEPDEARNHVLLGDIYEAQGDYTKALEALSTAAALQPDDALTARLETLRSRAAFEAMPAEYRAIESANEITRAQLAALFAVRLEPMLAGARSVNAVVITDTRGHWASPYILAVGRAAVMEVYPNHTFQPDAVVRRDDLARASSRVLELIAKANPQLAAAWRNPRRKFPDLPSTHFSYPAAALAVEAGVMTAADGGNFQLTRPVTGPEAVAAVNKLQELGGRPAR
jgi:tetratricopeptide (TPR) repeat protein